jgi:hypothetical protein
MLGLERKGKGHARRGVPYPTATAESAAPKSFRSASTKSSSGDWTRLSLRSMVLLLGSLSWAGGTIGCGAACHELHLAVPQTFYSGLSERISRYATDMANQTRA